MNGIYKTNESFDFSKFDPLVIAVEIHGNDIKSCISSPVAGLLFSKGYKCVASCVITFFFVKIDPRIQLWSVTFVSELNESSPVTLSRVYRPMIRAPGCNPGDSGLSPFAPTSFKCYAWLA